MSANIEQQHFPMKLPAGVEARVVDEKTARQVVRTIGPAIFDSRESLDLFIVPKERRPRSDRLQAHDVKSDPMWIVMYDPLHSPAGWFYGYMEDEISYFMDTVALVAAWRRQGIYTAFLRQLVVFLREQGYERLTTNHHPNNRAVMIAELKVGFDIVGLELHESHGPLLKMAYFMHHDRREGFGRIFHMAPEL